MENEKFLFVVSGPSGVGKDSVVKKLRDAHPEIAKTVSATTRAPRPGEQEGVDYYYCTQEKFRQLLAEDQIVEHNYYNQNYYGTLRSEVNRHLEAGRMVVLVIDVHGAANIKRLYPGANTIFLLPPSIQELEQRLRGRGTEDEETIQKRLAKAREEIPHAKDYDYIVYNDALEDAVSDLRAIIKAEKLKFSRNTNSIERVLEDAETVR